MSEQMTSQEVEFLLPQFNRLINELLRGSMNRNTFQPWEIALLLDIETCNLKDSNRREVLRRYQKAAQRQIEAGAQSILKLSEYLEKNRSRRVRQAAPAASVTT
jgi:hypothetical protein